MGYNDNIIPGTGTCLLTGHGTHCLEPQRAKCWWLCCRQILDSIEKNGYNNFTKRAYVPKWKKYLSLPIAFGRATAKPAVKQSASKQIRMQPPSTS